MESQMKAYQVLVAVLVLYLAYSFFSNDHEGLPARYVCDCPKTRLLCDEGELDFVLNQDDLTIGGSIFNYTTKGRRASLFRPAIYEWTTVNRPEYSNTFFEFHFFQMEARATYENEFGKSEHSCVYQGSE